MSDQAQQDMDFLIDPRLRLGTQEMLRTDASLGSQGHQLSSAAYAPDPVATAGVAPQVNVNVQHNVAQYGNDQYNNGHHDNNLHDNVQNGSGQDVNNQYCNGQYNNGHHDNNLHDNVQNGNGQYVNNQYCNGQCCNIQYGNNQYDNGQYGNTQYCNDQSRNDQCCYDQCCNNQYGNAQHGNAQYGNTQYGDAQHGNAQHGNAQQNEDLPESVYKSMENYLANLDANGDSERQWLIGMQTGVGIGIVRAREALLDEMQFSGTAFGRPIQMHPTDLDPYHMRMSIGQSCLTGFDLRVAKRSAINFMEICENAVNFIVENGLTSCLPGNGSTLVGTCGLFTEEQIARCYDNARRFNELMEILDLQPQPNAGAEGGFQELVPNTASFLADGAAIGGVDMAQLDGNAARVANAMMATYGHNHGGHDTPEAQGGVDLQASSLAGNAEVPGTLHHDVNNVSQISTRAMITDTFIRMKTRISKTRLPTRAPRRTLPTPRRMLPTPRPRREASVSNVPSEPTTASKASKASEPSVPSVLSVLSLRSLRRDDRERQQLDRLAEVVSKQLSKMLAITKAPRPRLKTTRAAVTPLVALS
ncbi:hypothetical protein GGS21DRAFT_529551 [Xylaria nigripes]|nr:hypothetical protein GGS21DRAFT_529551 [Xylaria nigripes]